MNIGNRYNQDFVTMVAEHCTRLAVISLTRKYRLNRYTIQRWRAKYGAMDLCKTQRLGVLEAENLQLRLAISYLTLDFMALKDASADQPMDETNRYEVVG